MATMTFPRGATNRVRGANPFGQYQTGPYGSSPTQPSWLGPRDSNRAPVIRGVSALKSAEIMNDWRNGKGTSKLQAEQAQDQEKAHQAMRELAFEKGYENARRKMGLAGDKTTAPAPAPAAPVAKPATPGAKPAEIAGPPVVPQGRMGGSQDVSGKKMSDWLAEQKKRQKEQPEDGPDNEPDNDEDDSVSAKSESASDISARLNKNLTAMKNVQDEVNPAITKAQGSLDSAQHHLNKTQDAIDAPLDEAAIKARGEAGAAEAQKRMDAEGGVGSPEYMANLNKASEAAAKNAATNPPVVGNIMPGNSQPEKDWRANTSANDTTISDSLSKMDAESRAHGGPVKAMKHKMALKRADGGAVGGATQVGLPPGFHNPAAAPSGPPSGEQVNVRVGNANSFLPGNKYFANSVSRKKGGDAKSSQLYKVGDAKGATKSNPKPELFMPNEKGSSPQIVGQNGPETGTFGEDGVVIPNHALHAMKKKFAAQKAEDEGDEVSPDMRRPQ